MVEVRRLGPGDRGILDLLAREDADFDVEGRGRPRHPPRRRGGARLPRRPSRSLLESAGRQSGRRLFCLYALAAPLRSGAGRELLLYVYEIGVRQAVRRQGVGRALMAEMRRWMRHNAVADAWVLADNDGAVAFYHAMGFSTSADRPRYMVLSGG